jgi:hypothetical protein
VQLLWLNLVTNDIQDIALAGESPEGDELSRAPRRPSEPIFDRLMIRRIWQSSLVMGAGGFAMFYVLLEQGYGESEARNLLLLLFVLFENFQTPASRCASPSSSLAFLPTRFSSSQSQRPGPHIAAMYTPILSETAARVRQFSGSLIAPAGPRGHRLQGDPSGTDQQPPGELSHLA